MIESNFEEQKSYILQRIAKIIKTVVIGEIINTTDKYFSLELDKNDDVNDETLGIEILLAYGKIYWEANKNNLIINLERTTDILIEKYHSDITMTYGEHENIISNISRNLMDIEDTQSDYESDDETAYLLTNFCAKLQNIIDEKIISQLYNIVHEEVEKYLRNGSESLKDMNATTKDVEHSKVLELKNEIVNMITWISILGSMS